MQATPEEQFRNRYGGMDYVLTKNQRAAVERLAKSGRYNNKSEVVRAAINLLEDLEREKELALRDAPDSRKRGPVTQRDYPLVRRPLKR